MKKIIALLLLTTLTGTLAMSESTAKTKTASFGGGCFWCLEPFFEQLKGVSAVESGYQGGQTENPTYKEVTSGRTGHAEVVRVTYDPDVISYGDLLKVFFTIHDPTTLNRQGNDKGTQYRSTILYSTDEEKAQAAAYIKELTDGKYFKDPIVTKIETAGPFYKAEAYHQDYYAKNQQAPYCRLVIAPKLKKIQLPEDLLKK
jgi:peptide-methionine (S)-S-oxide reductase